MEEDDDDDKDVGNNDINSVLNIFTAAANKEFCCSRIQYCDH